MMMCRLSVSCLKTLGHTLLIGYVLTLFSPILVFAEKKDWSRQFAGLDGVRLFCIDHSDGGYGESLCQEYMDAITASLKDAEIVLVRQGYFRSDEAPPENPPELNRPLNLTLFIRGTAGGDIAIQLRSRASVSYAAAVEKSGSGEGRSGELVMWERSTTGSGPAGQLRPAIVQAMVSRTASLIRLLTNHWPE